MDAAKYFIRRRHAAGDRPGPAGGVVEGVQSSSVRAACAFAVAWRCTSPGMASTSSSACRAPGTCTIRPASPSSPSLASPAWANCRRGHRRAQRRSRGDPDRLPVSRVSGKAMPRGRANGEPRVNAPRKRDEPASGTALLYHRAGLNRWYPAMEGRRSQGVIKKYLELAAAGVTLKGETLDKRLYVPEPFRVADKEEIGERRRRKLAMLLSPGDDVAYKMAIVIGSSTALSKAPTGAGCWSSTCRTCRCTWRTRPGSAPRRLCGHPAGP